MTSMRVRYVAALYTSLLLATHASASIINNGKDVPISTDKPTLKTVQCTATPGPLFDGHQGPFPTDSWWTGFGVLPQTSFAAGPYPYMSQALPTGVVFGVGTNRKFDGVSIHVPYQPEVTASATEFPNNIENHKAITWDPLSVEIQWFSGASTMNAYLVQGSAYMTFKYATATPTISATISNVNDKPITTGQSVIVQGSKVKFTISNSGATYVLYSVGSSLNFTATPAGLKATEKHTGVIRIARLNTTLSGSEAALDMYAPNYVTGASISYTVANDVANVIYDWNVVGNKDNVLMCAWPHHRELLVSPKYVSQVAYLTLKGLQVGVLGPWTLKYQLTTKTWHAPRKPVASCLPLIEKALEQDVAALKIVFPGDMYFWGGSFARVARLALIAEEVGRTDLIPAIVKILKASFTPWLDGTGTDPAAFEIGWGGIVAEKGATNPNVDFGNGYYNDHHFHYGYHLYGAAVIAKFDSTFLNTQTLSYLTYLARDIGNPSSLDTSFTISRMKDWFAGHSWASGIANGAGDRDQESSTEAINGYFGLYMFALASNNQNLQDFSRLLLAMEIQSVRHYWHLYPNDNTINNPYPEAAFRAQTTVGNVMSSQSGAWLFWGSQRSEIASIQILPVTPITEEVLDPEWVTAMYPWVATEIPDPKVADSWKSLVYIAHAVLDPHAGYLQSNDLTDWGSGNSNSNTLWWIATRTTSDSPVVCTPNPNVLSVNRTTLMTKSGKYVTVGSNNILTATATSSGSATLWTLKSVGSAYTLQNPASKMYVSADQSGTNPLIDNRATASTWETFIFKAQANNYFAIKAASNGDYVSVQANNELVPSVSANVGTIPDNALFMLVCPPSTSCKGN